MAALVSSQPCQQPPAHRCKAVHSACLSVHRTRPCRPTSLGSAATKQASIAPVHHNITCCSYNDDPIAAEQCVRTAASALAEDPSTSYFCWPGAGQRFYQRVLMSQLKAYPYLQQLYMMEQSSCCAIAYPYAQPPLPLNTQLSQLLTWPWDSVRWNRAVAGNRAAEVLEQIRSSYCKAHGQFLYISMVATAPHKQRQGLGSVMLDKLLQLAAEGGMHCYLEATSEANRRLYLRHGFENVATYRPSPAAPPTFIMAKAVNQQSEVVQEIAWQ
eukprot:jgi/Chrzof1/2123/Cz11g03130.t1